MKYILATAILFCIINSTFAQGTVAGKTPAQLNTFLFGPIGSNGQVLTVVSGVPDWADPAAGSGTVTSVALTLPSFLTVSGSPVTTSGTLAVSLASQSANTFLAAPNASSGTPTFRTIAVADIPTLNQNTTGTASNVTGTVAIENGGTGMNTRATALNNLLPTQTGNANKFLQTDGLDASWATALTGNQTITLSGDVSGSGATSISTTVGAIQNKTITLATGFLKYNGTAFVFDNTSYGTGTVTSVDASGSHGITVSGNPITTTGTLAFDLSLNGVALDRLATIADGTLLGNNSGSTGSVLALSSSAVKTLLSLNNVENTALSTWAGSTNLTTLGTIGTGTWNGTTIAIANGGTGQTTAQAAIDALLPTQTGNSGKFLTTDGTNSSWAAGGASGVTSITGTANQVLANGNSGTSETGSVTLTLPQSIATSSTPQFGKVGLGTPITGSALTELLLDNATTNTVDTMMLFRHNSSGTPAANFGLFVGFRLKSSTTSDREAAGYSVTWNTATDASRAAVMKFYTTTSGTMTNYLSIGGGSASGITFPGVGNGMLTTSSGGLTINALTANSILIGSSTSAVNGTSTNLTYTTTAGQIVKTSDAVTNTTTTTLTLGHNSSGTPLANYGTCLLYQGKSSTTADQDMAMQCAIWSDATHASRTAKFSWKLTNNAAALAEVMSLSGPGVLTLPNLASGAMYSASGVVSSEANLDVTRGGTGVGTFTANGVLLGNGTSDIAVTAVGTTGQVLAGNTGSAPTFQTLTGGGYLTSDVTTTSTSFVDVTGMSFSIGANEVWTFEMYIIGAGVNSANCEVAVNGPASPTAIDAGLAKINTSSSVAKRVASYDAGFTSFTIEASSATIYKMNGIIRNGSNAGTVILRVKSLDAADAGIAANSYVEAHKK